MTGMAPYVPPEISSPVYRDAGGNVIEYGNRWRHGGPPDDSYSVDTHPERFRPLHAVADALVVFLVQRYDVDFLDDRAAAADLLREQKGVHRAIRVTPRKSTAAALTFVFTSYPGVLVHAGGLTDLPFPPCGCDACDDTWERLADDLEWKVLAVADGRFRESIAGGPEAWVESAFTGLDGSSSGSRQLVADAPAERVRHAKSSLSAVAGSWDAWPLRHR
jgi:hypothetical protein